MDQLGGPNSDNDVASVSDSVSDNGVETAHLPGKAVLEKPAELAGIREVAHGVPPGNYHHRLLPSLLPEGGYPVFKLLLSRWGKYEYYISYLEGSTSPEIFHRQCYYEEDFIVWGMPSHCSDNRRSLLDRLAIARSLVGNNKPHVLIG